MIAVWVGKRFCMQISTKGDRAEISGWNTTPESSQDVACDATGLLLFFSRRGNS